MQYYISINGGNGQKIQKNAACRTVGGGGKMPEYRVVRSKRKTLGIYVLEDGQKEVRCPRHISDGEIEKFVAKHRHKLDFQADKKRQQVKKKAEFSLQPGDSLLYLGREYPLKTVTARKAGFDFESFFVPEGLSGEESRQLIIKVYKSLARKILMQKTLDFARQMGLTPGSVKITSAKKRWGSCTSKKNINYSWRLIMAPESAVNYVVVHELAHLAQLNHSRRFWQLVEKYVPDRKEQSGKLRELQDRLSVENWD